MGTPKSGGFFWLIAHGHAKLQTNIKAVSGARCPEQSKSGILHTARRHVSFTHACTELNQVLSVQHQDSTRNVVYRAGNVRPVAGILFEDAHPALLPVKPEQRQEPSIHALLSSAQPASTAAPLPAPVVITISESDGDVPSQAQHALQPSRPMRTSGRLSKPPNRYDANLSSGRCVRPGPLVQSVVSHGCCALLGSKLF